MNTSYNKHSTKKDTVLSRDILAEIYFGSNDSHRALRFQDDGWKYKVEVILRQLNSSKAPKPIQVTLRCCKEGTEDKSRTFIPEKNDRSHFIELVYLLAAKLKYDLLNGNQYDNAGFLLSQEIIRLNEDGLTCVQKALNHTLGRLYRKSMNHEMPEWYNFLGHFLTHPDQIWHLVNRLGKSGSVAANQRYVWWLNIDPTDVSFKDISGNIIKDNLLKKWLEFLFPARCLYNVKELEELSEIIEKGSRNVDHKYETKTLTEATYAQPNDPYKEKESVLKKVLKDQAIKALYKKLDYSDLDAYYQLDLECGTIKSEAEQFQTDHDLMENKVSDHKRVWNDFNLELLHEPFGYFILNSDVGTGKTTFLRYLQSIFLEKDLLIPVYISAKQIEELNSFCITDLIKAVTKRLNSDIDNSLLVSYFEEARKRQKIVWLIDGLDQISGMGTAYKCLIDDILKVIDYNIIISSRPTAVVSEETNEKVTFLRLRPFSKAIQKEYFGINYERSQELCKNCPEITSIPMLAYMVRELIENKQDTRIKNRSQLYRRFINYIFKKYHHEQLKISKHLELQIRRNLEKISYDAFKNNTPHIQKIPLEFAYDHIDKYSITVDDLTKYGLVNLIIDKTYDSFDFLYFTHQSFQEYMAAEYIAKSDGMIKEILNEMWNPKWKEVIKFLTGIKGQEIIEIILEKKDNPIHSKLFLSAELISESTDASMELKDRISHKIETLLDDPLYGKDAEKCLTYVNENIVINRLINMVNTNKRFSDISDLAEQIIPRLNDKVKNEVYKKIVERLDDRNTCCTAMMTLLLFKNEVDSDVLGKVVANLGNEDKRICESAKITLINFVDRADKKLLEIIVDKLIGDSRYYKETIWIFSYQIEKIDDKIFKYIVKKLDDKDPASCILIINIMGQLKNKVTDEVFKKIVEKLDDEDLYVRLAAIRILGKLKDKVTDEIFSKIVEKLSDENPTVRLVVISVLGELKDKRTNEIYGKIVNGLYDEDRFVRGETINTLRKLKDMITDEVFERIVEKISDDSPGVSQSAIWALVTFKDKVNYELIDNLPKIINIYCYADLIRMLTHKEMKNMVDIRIITKIVKDIKDYAIDINYNVISLLGELKDIINSELFRWIVDKLDSIHPNVRLAAIRALRKLNDKVTDEVNDEVFRKIISKLDDENPDVCSEAIWSLSSFKDKVDNAIVKKLIKLNNIEAYSILKELYRYGKLNLLESEQ